ncbi:MAG: hypothetical protein NC079_00685 [Clostridium sp.]|nr:hypothetical protein [Acetatifactor muris]MCM1527447.1 hypothetical protein [Bacteroides sp.]MCM1562107.1 hypothetical protein [Clostridium sp.]
MLCDPASRYPDHVDAMTFFQDTNLKNIEVMRHYDSLVAQGRYDAACDHADQQEGIYGFFANFLNLIENRIDSLQDYLLSKPVKQQPFCYYEEKTYGVSIFSDTDSEEPLKSILLFSADDTADPFEMLCIFIGDTEMTKDELEPPHVTQNTIWI